METNVYYIRKIHEATRITLSFKNPTNFPKGSPARREIIYFKNPTTFPDPEGIKRD